MNAASWLDRLPAPDKWRGALLTHAPRIVTWTLALALGVQAAIVLTDLAGARRVPATVPAPASVNGAAASQRVDIAAITQSHLFGAAPTDSAPAEVDAANAPRTNMPLVLTGIIAQSSPDGGFAIIGESANAAKVYAVGDRLPGGVRLHSVHGDRVLIERNGRVESLTLPRQYSSRPPPPPPPVASAPPPLPGEAAGERIRQIVTDQPGVVAEIMRPQPVFAQGKQQGYRVYPGRNREMFMRLGLRPGDLVVAINGSPLDDPARSPEIFRTIGASSEVRVTVMRNGRQQELSLDMSQVASEAGQLAEAAAQNGGTGNAAPATEAPVEGVPAEVTPPPEAPIGSASPTGEPRADGAPAAEAPAAEVQPAPQLPPD